VSNPVPDVLSRKVSQRNVLKTGFQGQIWKIIWLCCDKGGKKVFTLL